MKLESSRASCQSPTAPAKGWCRHSSSRLTSEYFFLILLSEDISQLGTAPTDLVWKSGRNVSCRIHHRHTFLAYRWTSKGPSLSQGDLVVVTGAVDSSADTGPANCSDAVTAAFALDLSEAVGRVSEADRRQVQAVKCPAAAGRRPLQRRYSDISSAQKQMEPNVDLWKD